MTKFRAYRNFTAQANNVSALMSLVAAIDSDDTNSIELTPVVVFLAFSIEAYLNALGDRHLPFWSELERLPWRSKIEILYKTAKAIPDWGMQPLQFVAEIFSIRDKLAHGKPECVEGKLRDTNAEAWDDVEILQPDWILKITKPWVKNAELRFHALMTHMARMFEENEDDYLHHSSGSVTPLDA
jgi:hypothetical protein